MVLKLVVTLVAMLFVTTLLRVAGPPAMLPLIPVVPLALIGGSRYYRQREQQRQMRCPRCDLPLAYRKLGPNHGMLECPALCGYRRFVGNPSAGR